MWDNMLGKGDQMTPNDFFSFRGVFGFFWEGGLGFLGCKTLMIGRMDRGFCRVGLAAMLPLFHEQDFAEPDGIVPPNCNEDLTIPLAI